MQRNLTLNIRSALMMAGLVLAIGLLVALAVGPGLVERTSNGINASAAVPVSEAARRLHDALFIADLHADQLLWDRDPLDRAGRGHTDIPRLIEGRVGLQVFSTVTRVPKGLNYERNPSDSDLLGLLMALQARPIRAWSSPLQRALVQAAPLRAAAASAPHRFTLMRTVGDLDAYLARRSTQPATTAGLLATEGLHALEGNLDNLDVLFDAGFRMMGLTHFFDNRIAGSAHGKDKGGLTDLGRRVVRRMERRGIIVDLAHASPRTFDNVLAMATRPVVVSHTGVQGTCPGSRNLTDAQLAGIAANGGLVGIGFWDGAVCTPGPAAIARAIRYAADRIGVDHVALGSDFDGAVTVPFDAAGLDQLTQALLDAGFTPDEIRKIMGENVVRLLRATLPRP